MLPSGLHGEERVQGGLPSVDSQKIYGVSLGLFQRTSWEVSGLSGKTNLRSPLSYPLALEGKKRYCRPCEENFSY